VVELGHAYASQLPQGAAQHHLGGDLGEGATDGLGHEGDGPRGSWVGLDHVDLPLFHSELKIEQPSDVQTLGDPFGDVDDLRNDLR